MANKDPKETPAKATDTKAVKAEEGASVKKNTGKIVAWIGICVVVVVAAVLGVYYGVMLPAKQKGDVAIGKADVAMATGNDSIALVQYMDVAKNYGSDAGNRANLNAAIILYKQGKYEEAINYLNSYKPTEEVIGAASLSLKGDCYSNLQKYDEALKCYQEAVKVSKDNPNYTPFFLMKEAVVYRELKNYKEEAAVYESIIANYPQYGSQMQIDVKKYLERAKADAGE